MSKTSPYQNSRNFFEILERLAPLELGDNLTLDSITSKMRIYLKTHSAKELQDLLKGAKLSSGIFVDAFKSAKEEHDSINKLVKAKQEAIKNKTLPPLDKLMKATRRLSEKSKTLNPKDANRLFEEVLKKTITEEDHNTIKGKLSPKEIEEAQETFDGLSKEVKSLASKASNEAMRQLEARVKKLLSLTITFGSVLNFSNLGVAAQRNTDPAETTTTPIPTSTTNEPSTTKKIITTITTILTTLAPTTVTEPENTTPIAVSPKSFAPDPTANTDPENNSFNTSYLGLIAIPLALCAFCATCYYFRQTRDSYAVGPTEKNTAKEKQEYDNEDGFDTVNMPSSTASDTSVESLSGQEHLPGQVQQL